MDEERAIYLYNAISSFIRYCNFVEGYGERKELLKKVDFDFLIANYACFLYVETVDKYIVEVSKNEKKILLNSNFLTTLANIVGEKKDDGYHVGNLVYKDANTLLIKLRNKFAHCNHTVVNGKITFEEKNGLASIDISKMQALAGIAALKIDDYKLCEDMEKFIIVNETADYCYPSSFPNFKMYAKNIKILTIKSLLKPGFIRTDADIVALDKAKERVSNYIKEKAFTKENISKLENELNKNNMVSSRIKLDYSSLEETPYYKEVEEYCLNKGALFATLPKKHQIQVLSDIIWKKSQSDETNYNIRIGLLFNLYYLKYLKEYPNLSMDEFFKIPALKKAYFNSENIIFANIMIGFYYIFQFGLENGFTDQTKYDIKSLLTGKNFDFSKLDTKCLEPSGFTAEFRDPTPLFASQKEELDAALENLATRKANLIRYKDCHKNGDLQEPTVTRLESLIDEAEKKYQEKYNERYSMLDCLLHMDINKFAVNHSLITKVRNSIAHANEKVIDDGKEFTERKITIKDIFEGECVFEKCLTFHEFSQLFSYENVVEISEYYKRIINDKSQIDEKFLEDVWQEQLKRTKTPY